MTEKIHDGIKEQAKGWNSVTLMPKSEFKILLDEFSKNIYQMGKEDKPLYKFDKDKSFEHQLSIISQDTSNRYGRLVQATEHAEALVKAARDYDSRYLSIKTKESWIALGFRIATTLAIGFSIMLVYWVAHCLEIPMPLLRMPIG